MKNLYSSIIVVLFAAFAVAGVVFAFTAPTAIPPGDNVSPPLNGSFLAQEKLGGLILGTGTPWPVGNSGLIVAQGNVGFGTTTPQAPLEVASAGVDCPGLVNADDKCTALRITQTDSQDAVWELRAHTFPTIDNGFSIWGGSEGVEATRLSINTDGNVGIGTGNNEAEARLHVVGDATLTNKHLSIVTGAVIEGDNIGFQIIAEDATAWMSHLILTGVPSSGNNKHWMISHWGPDQGNRFGIGYDTTTGSGWSPNSADDFTITTAGNVGINDTTPSFKLDVNGSLRAFGITDSSDLRLKKDIVAIDNALDSVLQLQGVYYQWIDEQYGTELKMGLIGQEVEQIFPEVVLTDEEGFKSIQYGKLTAALIEAIKEQQAQIEQLRAELEELRGQIQ